MHTDGCGNTRRQKCCAKGSGKEVKIQEFMYRDTTKWNMKCTIIPEIIGVTGIVTRSLRKNLEAVPEGIRYVHYKRQLYLEHHT